MPHMVLADVCKACDLRRSLSDEEKGQYRDPAKTFKKTEKFQQLCEIKREEYRPGGSGHQTEAVQAAVGGMSLTRRQRRNGDGGRLATANDQLVGPSGADWKVEDWDISFYEDLLAP